MSHQNFSESQYALLRNEDKSPSEQEYSENVYEYSHPVVRTRRILGIPVTLLCISLLANALFFICTSLAGMHWLQETYKKNRHLRNWANYSPVYDLLDLEPRIRKVDGTLFPTNNHSIARQMPNPEADAIWDEWELTRVFPLKRRELINMGKDPTYVAKLEDDIWGLGDDAYAGIFDVYHQLHCLNSLRQIAYGTYYNQSMVDPDPRNMTLQQHHLNHCVDILMQALQCSGNVNFIPMEWVATQEYPFPDMSVNQKCVNFNKLTNWRKENTINMDIYKHVMKKPKGVKEKPMADQYYEYRGLDNPNHVDGANSDTDFNV